MIQANELRIGNWVNIGQEVNKLELVDFVDMYENDTLKHYKPIPITEDILLKCGFKRDIDIVYRYYLTYDYSILLAYDLDDSCVRIGDSWDFSILNYVHELQNLIFALTKTELTINL